MNEYRSKLLSPEPSQDETSRQDLSAVAEQLVEAACRARDGDRVDTIRHIARAVALLRAKPSPGRRGMPTPSDLATHIARGGLPAWQAHTALAYVEANLSGRIAIPELARMLGLSASHFCRAFKSTCGVSPRNYVLGRRIERAKGLMLTTSEPLCSIALSCGMYDQAHFTRSFRRMVGETPYTWRRARQGVLKID